MFISIPKDFFVPVVFSDEFRYNNENDAMEYDTEYKTFESKNNRQKLQDLDYRGEDTGFTAEYLENLINIDDKEIEEQILNYSKSFLRFLEELRKANCLDSNKANTVKLVNYYAKSLRDLYSNYKKLIVNVNNLILNYNITYGGQATDCTPSQSLLFARNINHVIMEDAGYSCKMTTIGQSSVKTLFAIDYVDLDYGYIGGRYSIGISGPAYGGSNGYMMLRMPKNAYPLSPQLKAPTKTSRKGANPYGANIKTTLSNDSTTGNNISDTVQVFPIKK